MFAGVGGVAVGSAGVCAAGLAGEVDVEETVSIAGPEEVAVWANDALHASAITRAAEERNMVNVMSLVHRWPL